MESKSAELDGLRRRSLSTTSFFGLAFFAHNEFTNCLADNEFAYKPAPAEILNIVLESQLLCISESLGRSKGEGEGEEEKEHVGQVLLLSSCLPGA